MYWIVDHEVLAFSNLSGEIVKDHMDSERRTCCTPQARRDFPKRWTFSTDKSGRPNGFRFHGTARRRTIFDG